jgi:hypothetical protein
MEYINNLNKRIEKSTEIKENLNKYNIHNEVFLEKLNNWVETGEFNTGVINLPELKKDLVYQLTNIEETVIKLADQNQYEIKKEQKINSFKQGRNDICNCGSNKKYKKCCGKI